MFIIKTILYQLKKRPLLTIMLIFVITFVMTFLSVTYSSMNYNKKVYQLINGGHDSKNAINYTLVSQNKDKSINKEALKKIIENCDIELSFFVDIDCVNFTTNLIYLRNKPQIILYDKRKIKEGDFYKAYLGRNLAEEYKDNITILEKNYPIGETVGINGQKSKLDSGINIYVDNIKALIDSINKGDFSGGAFITLYKNNKDYLSYDEDMKEVFNEKNYYIRNVTRKGEGVKDLKYGFEYVSLIVIGVVSVISISTFWIRDRKRDIAIKRAFGAKNKHIVIEVYKELLTLCIFCGIISFIGNFIINKISNTISAIMISVDMKDFVTFLITTIILSSLVAIIPIYKALKLEIVTSLKGR